MDKDKRRTGTKTFAFQVGRGARKMTSSLPTKVRGFPVGDCEVDEWETPSWIFDPLMQQYNFEFDCCASQENKKCPNFTDDFLSREQDYLEDDTCWMNPPFSKAYLMFEHFFKVVEEGVAIYRCDNFETGLWQNVIFPNADWIFIPDRRVNYEGHDGEGARFPSALIGKGLPPPMYDTLSGTLLLVRLHTEETQGVVTYAA